MQQSAATEKNGKCSSRVFEAFVEMLHEWKKKQDTELFCFHSILQSQDYKLE